MNRIRIVSALSENTSFPIGSRMRAAKSAELNTRKSASSIETGSPGSRIRRPVWSGNSMRRTPSRETTVESLPGSSGKRNSSSPIRTGLPKVLQAGSFNSSDSAREGTGVAAESFQLKSYPPSTRFASIPQSAEPPAARVQTPEKRVRSPDCSTAGL